MRFEPPDSRNRWDSPLFLVHPEEQLPFQQIYDALFLCKAPPPNHSTLPVSFCEMNLLFDPEMNILILLRHVLINLHRRVPSSSPVWSGRSCIDFSYPCTYCCHETSLWEITRHYSQYCMLRAQEWTVYNKCSGHDIKLHLHPHGVKLCWVRYVGSGLVKTLTL